MRIVILALFVLIKGLIAIGDGVIWATKKLISPFSYTFKKLQQAVSTIKDTIHHKKIALLSPIKWAKAKYFTFTARKEQVLLVHKKRKKPLTFQQHPSFTLPFKGTYTFLVTLGSKIPHTLPSLPSFHISFPHIHLALPPLPKRTVVKSKKVSLPAKKVVTKTSVPFSHLSFIVKCKYFFAGTVFSLLFLFLPLLSFIYIQDLPNPKALSLGEIPQTTKIYDRHGTLLYQIYAGQNRTLVHLSDIPDYLQKATIATEDKDFYHHPGFDISAIIRSAVGNAKGENLQGGSTLTQQLIKSSLLTPETSISRKVKEAILAFWAERIYTKNQILEMYFNQIPYGGTAWGAEAAAEVYFDKHVKDLDLAQSAFLAGIPQAPTALAICSATLIQ
jgi:hypothetical protein